MFTSGVVDMDAALNIALQKFRLLVGHTKEYVIDIFKSCDVY